MAYGQEGKNQKITIQNFEVEVDAISFFDKIKGVECEFDVRFSEVITDFMKQSYRIKWRLEDKNGTVVFESDDASGFHDRSTTARATKPFGNRSADYGLDDNVDLFIAYRDLNLETGRHTFNLILTAEHEEKHFPDFFQKEISFEYEKIKIYSFREQGFKVSNLRFEQNVEGFGAGLGMEMAFDLNAKYGPNQSSEASYQLSWKFLDAKGNLIFDSDHASSIHHRQEYSSLKHFKKASDGWFREHCEAFTDYKDMRLSGEQTLTVIIYCAKDKYNKRQIFEEQMKVTFPALHDFYEQEFTITNFSATPTMMKGAQGLKVKFDCLLKYKSVVSNDRSGDTYYFYVKIRTKGRQVYHPVVHKTAYYSWSNEEYARLKADGKEKAHYHSIFIPYYKIDATKGSYKLEISLHATDKNHEAHFPTLQTTKAQINKPQVIHAKLNVSRLEVINKQYDPRFFNNYKKQRADVQWMVLVGNNEVHHSGIRYNHNLGYTGEALFQFSQGDELWLYVVDHDNGLNGDDRIGKIRIPYQPNGHKITESNLSEEDIEVLDYSFETQ